MNDLEQRARELFEQVKRSTKAYNLNSTIQDCKWEELDEEAKATWLAAVSYEGQEL